MIEDLKPYDKYHAAVAGLPPLPVHWALRRTKSLLREIERRSKTGTQRLLSLRMNAGLVDHHAMGGKHIPPSSLVAYKHVLPGELVMNRMRAAIGLFGGATSEGLVSPDYAIFSVRPELKVDYAVSLFKTPMMASLFRLESRGLGTGESGFLRLYSDRFGIIRMPLPPPEEQEAIVRFLDHATLRIDQFIRSKKKLIALLNEQKQAIIHRAVTRGLDPGVKLKDSGVPWLGAIPAHWEVLQLRAIADVIDPNPSHRNPTYTPEGFPFISTVEFIGADDLELNTPRRVALSTVTEQERRCQFRLGSIAFSRKGTIGAVRVLPHTVRFALLDSVCVVNAGPRIDYRYLYRQLGARVVAVQLGWLVRGAALKQVSVGRVRRARVVVPPRVEQQRIAEAIDEAIAPLRDALGTAENQVSLLLEYRTRLLSDVLTGQLDVRAAAASLPNLEPATMRTELEREEEAEIDDGEAA